MNYGIMKIQIVITAVILMFSHIGMTAETRKYLHEDAKVNTEFDNVYRAIAKAMKNNFIYREGAGNTADFIQTDLTCDNVWHDLDLSAIVPNDAKTVVLHVAVWTTDISKTILGFRKNGDSTLANVAAVNAQLINHANYGDLIVACDEHQIVEYYANIGISCHITVGGWFK